MRSLPAWAWRARTLLAKGILPKLLRSALKRSGVVHFQVALCDDSDVALADKTLSFKGL